MKKKGISAIIATVLVVLITVSSIAIIWIAIIPMIRDKLDPIDTDVRFNVISSKGYTVYDSETKMFSVQIKRGTDDKEINEMKVIVVFDDGNTIAYVVPAPGPNEMTTYTNSSPTGRIPISASVSPIVIKENREKEGTASGNIDFDKGYIDSEPIDPEEPLDADGPLDVPASEPTATNTKPGTPDWYEAEGGSNDIIFKLFNDYGEDIYLKSFNLTWTGPGKLTHIQTSRQNGDDSWNKLSIWNTQLNSPTTINDFTAGRQHLKILKDDYYVVDDMHFNGAVSGQTFNVTLYFEDASQQDIGSSTLTLVIP